MNQVDMVRLKTMAALRSMCSVDHQMSYIITNKYVFAIGAYVEVLGVTEGGDIEVSGPHRITGEITKEIVSFDDLNF